MIQSSCAQKKIVKDGDREWKASSSRVCVCVCVCVCVTSEKMVERSRFMFVRY
jgi:hypothetical protein